MQSRSRIVLDAMHDIKLHYQNAILPALFSVSPCLASISNQNAFNLHFESRVHVSTNCLVEQRGVVSDAVSVLVNFRASTCQKETSRFLGAW